MPVFVMFAVLVRQLHVVKCKTVVYSTIRNVVFIYCRCERVAFGYEKAGRW